MDDERIAIFELTVEDDRVRIVDEKHYRLAPAENIGPDDLRAYQVRSGR